MDNLNKMEIYNIQAIWEKKIKEQKGKGKHNTDNFKSAARKNLRGG